MDNVTEKIVEAIQHVNENQEVGHKVQVNFITHNINYNQF